jgi:D-cysteine desulfhydrase
MEEPDNNVPANFDALVCASGSGGTHAGMAVGFYESDTTIIGISTRHPKDKQTSHIHSLAQSTYRHILDDATGVFLPEEAIIVHDDYVGPGYSLPTQGMEEAVTLFARLEGILLDPVYTGKAAAGLIDLVRQGHFADGANVLFLHTGGAPSLYHYQPIATQVPGICGGGKVASSENKEDAEEKKCNY